MTLQEREALLTAQHGEVTTVSNAAKILSRARNTVTQMLKDGRIDYACEGSMVDVRSIARYIMAPKQEDFKAKVRRSGRKYMVV